MKTFSVQMSRQSDALGISPEKIYLQNINWPQQCPCCGLGIDGNHHYRLEHKPVLGGGLTTYLSWTVPTCKRCAFHLAFDNVVLIILWIIPPLLWVISGYLLFLAGYSEDILAIILWIILLVVLGAMSYLLRKLFKVFVKTVMMRKNCCSISFPIEVTSNYPDLSFHIKDDSYAVKLELANS